MVSRPPTSEQHAMLQTVLTALTDEDCRRILKTLTEPMSASEIREACDIPLSTAYRKLNLLSEAALVAERLDVSKPGKHTTRYVTDFDTVTVELSEEGDIQVSVESDVAESDPLSSSRWQEIRQQS